eukprot:970526-Rhodomonas_salina.2
MSPGCPSTFPLLPPRPPSTPKPPTEFLHDRITSKIARVKAVSLMKVSAILENCHSWTSRVPQPVECLTRWLKPASYIAWIHLDW